MKLFRKKTIKGCDARGDGESPYLTRFTLIETSLGAIYIHHFHRSDADEHHDHPWAFASLILWRGYVEETWRWSTYETYVPLPYKRRRRVWPGMVLFRRATHSHRVILVDGKPAWTLVIRGPKQRIWGFFTAKGWQDFKSYFTERGC